MRCYCPTCMREFAVDPVLVNANVRCPACEMLFDANEHIVSVEDVASKQEETSRKLPLHKEPAAQDAKELAGGFTVLVVVLLVLSAPILFCCVLPWSCSDNDSDYRRKQEFREGNEWIDDRLEEGHTPDEIDEAIRRELRRRGESTDY